VRSTSDPGPASGDRPKIPWRRRIQVHVALGVSVVVAFSLGAVLLTTTRIVTRQSMSLASDALASARSAFYHLVESRAESAAAQTRLITSLPVFRAHMVDVRLAADEATLDAMAEGYRRQLGAQFFVLTDRAGLWTAQPGWPVGHAPPQRMRDGIGVAARGHAHRDIIAIDNILFLIVSEPASFADEILGTVTVGYALDDKVARELADITHCDVNLVAGDRLSGSSLDPDHRSLFATTLTATAVESGHGVSLTVETLRELRYVAGTYPLFREARANEAGRLVLLQDWQPTERSLDELRGSLLRGGALIFAFALAGGIFFSRRVSRPLTDIAAAAGEMAQGAWTRQVPVRGSAEAITMAAAFNTMGTNLRRLYEEAKDKSDRLQASNDRFLAVTESARDGIVSTDAHGVVTFWNRSAEAIFGYAERDALGEPLTRFIIPPHRQLFDGALEAFARADQASTMGRTVEITINRKDGGHVPAEMSLSNRRSGGATSVTAVVRDITERKQAEAQARRHLAEIQSQRLRIFRATMTTVHDIVNNFLSHMQLIRLEAEGRLSEETLALFDRLIDENAKELRVLGDLETIREKELAIGTGIEYPSRDAAPDAHPRVIRY
jgi:PAS domain S-box-containing protein